MKIILSALTLFFIHSCSSRDMASDGPDLDVKPKAKTAKSVDEIVEEVDASSPPQEPSPEAVFDWQKSFQPMPSSNQRKDLEKRVAKLKSADTPEELLKLARMQTTLGQYAEAETSYREVIRKKRDHIPAMTDLTFLFLRARKTSQAFEILAQLKDQFGTQENPDAKEMFDYRYALALAYLANNDRVKGHNILSDLIGIDKTFAPAYAALANSYLAVNKDAVAEFVARRGLDRGKEDASLYNILGVIDERHGRNTTARQNYNRAIDLNSTFVPAMINRANLAIKELEFSLAEEDLKKAITIDSANPDAHIAMANVYRRTGRFAAAQKSLEAAIAQNPEDAIARYNLALVFAENLKRPDEALRLMNEVVQLSRDNAQLRAGAQNYINDLKEVRY